MKITHVATAATILTAALVLSACGGAQPADSAPPAATAPAPTSVAAPGAAVSTEHNQADIAFAQGMIPHHQQAVEMAKLATDRAESDDVRGLATEIEQAQGPEIAQMQTFLTTWGAPASGGMPGMDQGGMPGMDHGEMGQGGMGQGGMDHGGMAGMMTPDQMRQLEQADGAAFDRMFLEMMIAHHEGAVQMAQTELASGINSEAKALAQQIVDAQQAEIGQMRGLLG
ncbi:DUF305 domain-containing protein [Pseudonocardia alni]|jgi:uncharacterized protein (DUF305 family)|uniref:Uncharacterized protein (DUF305 family) n=2 Tax=Pseudonocardia alni TaxID=33907 RepID=A0AA44ZSG3_PSEA5|nr:DUF305 domain-containing protein [Pseudonocardia alni]NWJ75129.1 DUF305 domain-containing protein [Pseudonocardia pini]PKB41313.1 uncharacterized protein (DUF305 family) [Pseudonocardia alni]